MRYLLDTHIVLWAMVNDERLKKEVIDIINDRNNQIYYSSISPWEIELKHQKYPNFKIDAKMFEFLCDQNNLENIRIENKHINELSLINEKYKNVNHHDPFDKMLLAQAISENMILVTHDKRFAGYSSSHIMLV